MLCRAPDNAYVDMDVRSGGGGAGAMLFNLFMGNHDLIGASSLEDQCLAFQGALRDLGHVTLISNSLVGAPGVNLVFENFVPPYMEFFERALGNSIIGVICTERFEGSVLNVPEVKAIRVKNLPIVLNRCKFVWTLDPVSVAPLRAAFPAQRIFHMPIGYARALADIEGATSSPKLWDVCFTGSLTEYRLGVLNQLSASGLRVVFGHFPTFVRRSIMGYSRLQLTLKQFPNAYMPSQMRIAYCLANGFPVVSDFGGVPPETAIEDFCFNVPAEQLATQCRALLTDSALQADAADKIARFKSGYRMADLIKDAVAQSLA